MKNYLPLSSYGSRMGIEPGSIIMITSDSKMMLWDAVNHHANTDLNAFIDGIIEVIGNEGTLLFPTYNWSFCEGEKYDIRKTPCRTGSLGKVALKRKDFQRTQHPIYSFAVYGKYQDILCNMTNTDSFGLDSPFAFLKNHGAVNYIIDVSLKNSFTFVHFAEEQSGIVTYRYLKNFKGKYVDRKGFESIRTYSMFVRDLDLNVITTIDPIEKDFLNQDAEWRFSINSSTIKAIKLDKAYDIIMDDIRNNKSKKICSYIGQQVNS